MSSPQGIPQPNQPHRLVVAAAVTLLGSQRQAAVQSARERLLRWYGSEGSPVVLEALQMAAEAAPVALRLRARGLLRSMELRTALRRLGGLRPGRTGRSHPHALLEGAVLLTQLVRSLVPDADELGARLRGLAAPLRKEVAQRSLPFAARRLAEVLHGEAGLCSTRSSKPVEPAGAFAEGFPDDAARIDRVLLPRPGSALVLSLVYLLVARWAGLSAAGVALPGHFLVRLHGPRPVLLDPYHGGRSVTKQDCRRFLRAAGHLHGDHHLRDLSDAEVLQHYLRGLREATAKTVTPESRVALERALVLLEAM